MENKKKQKKTRSFLSNFLGLIVCGLFLINAVQAIDVKLLNTDPYPLKSGKYADIRLMVYDDSISEDDLEQGVVRGYVSFVDTFPFSILDKSSRKKSVLLLSEHSDEYYQLVEYRILIDSKVVDGDNELKFEIIEDGIKKTKLITVPVEKDKVQFDIGNFKTVPEKIYPDTEDIKLEIELNNFGDSNLKYLVGEVNSDAFISSNAIANRNNFGKLNSEESKTGIFFVDVPKDVKAGTYDLNLNVSFVEDDDINTLIQNDVLIVPINILGKPDFEIELIENEPVKQGKLGEFKFKVKNIGSDEAERLNVDLIKDTGVDIAFDKYTNYIGDLDVNQEGEGVFTFKVGRNADVKNNQVILSLRYVFEDEVFTQTINVDLNVLKRDKSLFENPIVIVVAFILVIVLGYYFRKKVFVKKK